MRQTQCPLILIHGFFLPYVFLNTLPANLILFYYKVSVNRDRLLITHIAGLYLKYN